MTRLWRGSGKSGGKAAHSKRNGQEGYVESVAEAFEKYLANGKPAYVKRETLTPEEGIKVIRDAEEFLFWPIHLSGAYPGRA